MSRYHKAISRTDIRRTLYALRSKYAVRDLDAWTASNLDGIELVGWRLRDLSAFIEKIFNVAVSTHAQGADGDTQLEEALHLCDELNGHAGGRTWTVLQKARPVERHGQDWSYYDFLIGAGIEKDGYWTKLLISSHSHIYNDDVAREECFRRAIDLWRLEQQLTVSSRNNSFLITARPPLQLRYLDNRPGNLNPTDVRVSGLPTLEQVLGASRAARDGLCDQVLETSFGCSLNREQYEQVYEQFNTLWKGWNIEVRGTITQGAEDILNGGELTEASPTWIPAFRWYEDEANAKVYGSVVIENGQRYVELATDGGSLELLQDRIAFLNDVQFTPVFP